MDRNSLTVSVPRLAALVFLLHIQSMPSPAQSTDRSPRVRIDTLADFPSAILGRSRTVRIVLPPGYDDNRNRYPVLFMNDGQDLEAMRVPEILDSLYQKRAVPPLILVAIHATGARLQEYGVAASPNAQGLGAEAGKYDRFLLEELNPAIRQRYRITRSASRTVVMGASLGGLAAFDLAWNHADVFGKVGVFSGSFWWRSNDSTVATKQASRIMHRLVRETRRVPKIRMWLEAGRQDERDDRDGNGVIDAIQDTRELMEALATRGFHEGREMTYFEVDGGHDPATWGQALPEFLRWAFKP
ncbi:MAG TPA: alpha/beta hydrolase-fold protein [Gemmatimonadales bacterium]|nr:alpha/beta hydrolase-fold protein [Gemmatimonadales bacterium]